MRPSLCVLLLTLGLRPAGAQPAPASQAQVVAITEDNFTVPQVRLANAAVAQRINRALLELAMSDAVRVDKRGTTRQQIHQANRASYYDDEGHYGQNSRGFTGSQYNVLLNQGYLLSVAIYLDFVFNHDEQKAHYVTFDLRTGHTLQLTDLLADAPSQLRRRMQGAITRRVGETFAAIKAAFPEPKDSAQISYFADALAWNETTRQMSVEVDDVAGEPDLKDFAVTPKSILIFHCVTLGYFDSWREPDCAYTFPFERLHPRELLVPVANAAAVKKH